MLPAQHTPLGGLSLVPVVLVCDCRETLRGRCPPALCRPRTRRATGVTPPATMGASSPQTCWAKCHRRPPELPPGPAFLLLTVLRCLCAAEPWLCHVALAPRHGRALAGGAQALLPSLFSLLFFSVLSPCSLLCPCLFLSPLPPPIPLSLSRSLCWRRFSQLCSAHCQNIPRSPRCWHCQPSPGSWSPCAREGLGGGTGSRALGDTEGARRAGGGCDQTSVG